MGQSTAWRHSTNVMINSYDPSAAESEGLIPEA